MQCQAALISLKAVALAAPELGPIASEGLCNAFHLADDCATTFGPFDIGAIVTQLIAKANVAGADGQVSDILWYQIWTFPDLTWFSSGYLSVH